MRVVVFGAAGFIGGAVFRLLSIAHGDHNVMGADVVAFEEAVSNKIIDVRDSKRLADFVKSFRPTCIVNLAGLLGTAETFDDVASTYQVNVLGAINILETCRVNRCRYIGVETGTDWPNAYAASKRAATDIAQAFHHSHNVPVTILKVFNAFGPRQKGVSPVRKIVPQFIRSAIRNEDLPIYGDGEQVIDMVPIGTVAEAFVAAVTHAPGCGEVIEVGTGVTTRVVEVAEAIKEHVGSSSGFRYLGNRLGEGKEHRAADTNLLEQLLGVSPSKSIRSELNKTVDWYLKNRTWLMLDQLDPSTS